MLLQREQQMLNPHQPELFDSAELRIEPPAFTGTHGHSSKRNVRRRRGTAVACGFAHAGDIAMGRSIRYGSAAVPLHARNCLAITMLQSSRF